MTPVLLCPGRSSPQSQHPQAEQSVLMSVIEVLFFLLVSEGSMPCIQMPWGARLIPARWLTWAGAPAACGDQARVA